jgi:hypothetical protein
MATVLSTSLSVGNFYLGQKILQAEFWWALTKSSFIQLLVLKVLSVKCLWEKFD